ncbi:hypothetical protein PHMEG_00038668 [Phytophthora megakarya]|uniref:Uncharacterized protein n=1 Tax=Phytophthora megakarya TaxID=4795 RepID=A0A225UGZ3_9STRA|nr:hypothetical protein PHMEG_00038668 [Phytophthora megakarya]
MNSPWEETIKMLSRELTAAGWKARKPTGLSVDYTYVKPGISGRLDATRKGKDFFFVTARFLHLQNPLFCRLQN